MSLRVLHKDVALIYDILAQYWNDEKNPPNKK